MKPRELKHMFVLSRRETGLRCEDCGHARYASNETVVGCSFHQASISKLAMLSSIKTVSDYMEHIKERDTVTPREMFLGWAYPLKAPGNKSLSEVSAGTVSEGVCQNGWVLVKKGGCCEHHTDVTGVGS